jgi:diguanylate cyclase (GGDEF)-like protein/PAS domain S-box-containing protein
MKPDTLQGPIFGLQDKPLRASMKASRNPVPAVQHESTDRVWQILEATTDCVLVINKDWDFVFLNSKAIAMIAQGQDLIGKNVWEVFPDALGTPFEAHYRQAARDKLPVSFEEYYPGLGILFEIHANPSGDDLVIFFRDITAQRARELELEKIEERYRLATLSTTEGIWDWDLVTDVVYYASRWNEIVGLPAIDFTGTLAHWRDRFHPRDLPRIEEEFKELQRSGGSEFQHEHRICHEDGSWHWILSRGTIMRDASGKITRMTGSISDITARKSVDPLTGLQNRLSLLESLEHRIAKPLVNHKSFALLHIGLDRFKQVKESFGQQSGDAALIEIARRLRSTLENDDLSVAARISGHEFLVLLERTSSLKDVVTYANLLQVLLERPIGCGELQMTLATSIGIAMGDEGYTAAEKMLEDAAIAMHQAEKSRLSKCIIFGARMREQTRRRVQIEIDIHGAVQANQLLLHYQPKVELRTGRIIGFEALIRWLHPTLGLIPPDDFIPCAEESTAILEIGHWTKREAIRQLMHWQAAGLISANLTMAVNLSTRQLEDPVLIQVLQDALAKEHAPPGCLTLEITESTLMGSLDQAREILGRLRDLGICLDLDDFGTGYSSLSYLHRLPFDAIKIDRSFIRDLGDSQESRAIAQSIIGLGSSLNMKVVAEGIETAEQRDRLIQLGCLYGQGYFFSKPLDPKAMEAVLRASNLAITA